MSKNILYSQLFANNVAIDMLSWIKKDLESCWCKTFDKFHVWVVHFLLGTEKRGGLVKKNTLHLKSLTLKTQA